MSACRVAGRCGGCPWIGKDYADELAEKAGGLVAAGAAVGLALPRPVMRAIAADGLRDRTDLRWDGAVLGLFDLAGAALVPVTGCPAVSPGLARLLAAIEADPLPIAPASLRLRVGPDGAEGVWVDAANVAIKALLDEGAWLRRRLADGVVVELGQRRKPVVAVDGRLTLAREPALRPWWRTWIGERPIAVYGAVGGFTQPSLAANRVLVGRVAALAGETGATRWAELGSGAGNLTFPLSALGTVRALEVDALARAALARGLAEAGLTGITVVAGDLARPPLDGVEAVLADPPRSGLGAGAAAITASGAGALLLVSCGRDALLADLAALTGAGWRIEASEGIDQFPRSPAVEWITRLAR